MNIASMQVARKEAGGEALMVVAADAEVPSDLLGRLATTIGASAATAVTLTDQP